MNIGAAQLENLNDVVLQDEKKDKIIIYLYRAESALTCSPA